MMDQSSAASSLPILDLSHANDPSKHVLLLKQLHDALFNVGFLYVKNHGVAQKTISNLVSMLPALFDQPNEVKAKSSKLNSPHFLGYSGYAEEITLGEKDLREQFDLATELPVIFQPVLSNGSDITNSERDFTKLYWRLRGPNQWPPEEFVPGFQKAFTESALEFRQHCTTADARKIS